MKVQLLCSLLFVLVGVSWAGHNPVCPFDYLYHFGDGVTDIGNSVRISPWGRFLPARRPPYGMTNPGKPNGRWCDGLIDFDFATPDFGFAEAVPYLREDSNSSKAVIFSVARSPVLDRQFFKSRGIRIPPYATSLFTQFNWFIKHLQSVCSSESECAKILGNALVLLGDIEANDLGYALSQGKSIAEVKTYVPYITRSQIQITRELVYMGATRIVIPGSSILGCYPYILTARQTEDPAAYDDLGCLKDVNELIVYKNSHLEQAVNDLATEFPDVNFYYGPFDTGAIQVFNETGRNRLKACCGTGGKYNYDSKRFCGRRGVPVCSNPDEYYFWDGIHVTDRASYRIESILVQGALKSLNCTTKVLPPFTTRYSVAAM